MRAKKVRKSKKRKRHPNYVSKHTKRVDFLSRIGTYVMLTVAAACLVFAVYIVVDNTRVPTQASTTYYTAASVMYEYESLPPVGEFAHDEAVSETEVVELVEEPDVETVSWIQILSPSDDYLSYDYPSYDYYIDEDYPKEYEEDYPLHYTQLSFFMHDNADLYAAFAYRRPDLDMETVIWMVNVSLHVPFFSEVHVNYQPNPLFVSPAFRLPSGFAPEELVPVNSDTCWLRATPETVAAFRYFRASARYAGLDISATSAFRTAARQTELWTQNGRRDGAVARPYHSEHQTGRALDLWGPSGLLDRHGPSPTGLWVAANAHYYGFIIRYRAETTQITGYIHEPWHITYVGTEISNYMHQNEILSLEEFVGRNPRAAL
ncbi:MAG: M15 family metallopeptidase [Defluviitaleaceae bacterium]|nr:M15 family metallopeptidase [Defluviitaleaceae bacterium]